LVSEPVSTPPPATKAPVVELPADNVVRLPPVKFKKARTTDQQYVTDALDRLGGVAESNDQLAETMGVLKGESSKRVSNCLEAGIITATRRGRYLEIRRAIEAA
jgi:hypothetical protein